MINTFDFWIGFVLGTWLAGMSLIGFLLWHQRRIKRILNDANEASQIIEDTYLASERQKWGDRGNNTSSIH